MIDPQTLSMDWLFEKRKQYGKDPSIMESMIRALYLLEQLKLSGLNFIFKGGTSLILILDQPKRFSIDIDIIVDPALSRDNLEGYQKKVVANSQFNGFHLDERRSYQEGIPSALHFQL